MLLVHGTRLGMVELVAKMLFRSTTWYAPHSKFRQRLAKELGPDVKYSIFEWDGGNTHDQRLAAARALTSHIAGLDSSGPGNVIVIAHSHGGNVALYACAHPKIADRVGVLACVATPFVHCAGRYLDPTLESLPVILLFPFFWGVFLLVSLVTVIIGWTLGNETSDLFFLELFFLLFTGFGIVGYKVLKRTSNRIANWARKRQAQAVSKYEVPFVRKPVFVATVAGDEASLWLRLLHFIGRIPFLLWRPQVPWTVFTVGLVYELWSNLLLWHASPRTPPLASWSMQIFGNVMSAPIFYSLTSIISIFWLAMLPKLVRAHRFGFGGESLSDNLLADIWADAEPFALDDITRSRYRVSRWAFWKLRHCSIFEDPALAQDLARWIADRSPKQMQN